MAVNKTIKAYLAGLFDGDGSVCISLGGKKKSDGTSPYRMMASIAQCYYPVLETAKNHYGGTICISNRNKKNPNHRDYYTWSVSNRQAERFLSDMYPYLMIKKEQVGYALEWQSTRKLGIQITPELHNYRESLMLLIKDLKHRTNIEYGNGGVIWQ